MLMNSMERHSNRLGRFFLLSGSSCLATFAVSGPHDQGQKAVVYGPFLNSAAAKQEVIDNEIRYAELVRGNPKQKTIALTFDDGPHPKWTPQLLALLKKLDVPATFFV